MFSKLIKLSILFVLLLAGYNTTSASFTISRPSTHNLGLVGHWTLDGTDTDWTTNTTLDRSGNGNTAKMINMSTSTAPTIGKIGQGFNFDGTNDYASTTIINNNEITIAGWFNKTANDFVSGTSDAVLGARYWVSDTQLREGFELRAGNMPSQSCAGVPAGSGYLCLQFTVETTDGGTRTEKTSAFNLSSISKNGTTTDEWFHIAGTYTQSDGNQRLYLNGVLRDTDLHVAGNTVVPLTGISACYNKFNIGYSCVNNGYFNGRLDDVRLYNRALSAGEIKTLYTQSLSKFNKTPTNILKNGLVGHWTFDGADTNWTTNTVADKSGQGNNGTMINMSTSTSPTIGRIGQALNFDVSTNFINIGDVLDASSGSMSVSSWVKLSTLDLSQTIVYKRHSISPFESWELYITSDNEAVFQLANTSASYFSAGTDSISKNIWYHIVGVKNNNNLKIYLNGIDNSVWSDTISGTVQNGDSEFGIGKDGVGGPYPFNGVIDEVRVSNRALSAEEVKLLYNMGR